MLMTKKLGQHQTMSPILEFCHSHSKMSPTSTYKISDGKQYHRHHQHSTVILSVGCVKVGAILCLMSLNLNGILTEVQLKQRKLALQLITQLVTQVRVVLIMGSLYI